jgi:hypothetical protein
MPAGAMSMDGNSARSEAHLDGHLRAMLPVELQAYINLFSRAADLIRSRPSSITGEASSNTYTAGQTCNLNLLPL